MAFENIIGGDNKQRINLSDYAYEVISSDMLAFNNKKFSNFINIIIDNFKETSSASISIMMRHEQEKLQTLFNSVPKINVDEKITKKLLEAKEKELLKNVSLFENGKSYRIRLNNRNMEYLTEFGSDCEEDRYYYTELKQNGKIKPERHPKIGKYLKALLEDYASKPFCEREQIYYKDKIDLINKIISANRTSDNKSLLTIRFFDQMNPSYIYPYEIVKDSFHTYNYVTGLLYNTENQSLKPITLRLSTVSNVKETVSKVNISEFNIETLKKAILDRGVQFLPGKDQEVVVYLTDKGKRMFSKRLHIRPNCIEIRNGCDYVFKCTPAQAKYYFVRFGKEAYVKEPESLRKEMLDYYRDAYNCYNG